MRLFVLAIGVVLACGAPTAAQVPLDLSAVGNVSQSTDPGEIAIVIKNRLPMVRYDIAVRREVIPIAAFSTDGLASLGIAVKPAERSDERCDPLAAAAAALEQSTAESQVPAHRAVVDALIQEGRCTNPQVMTPARVLIAATEYPLAPIPLRRGERLIVTVSRPAAEGQTVTWTLTMSTEPRGEWITSFGFSLFQDRDDHFVSRAVENGFRVVDDSSGWSLKVPAPSVYFSWLSSRQRRRDWSWGPSVGLGAGGTSPAVFGGIAINYNQNISFVVGAAVTPQRTLLGGYRVHPDVAENLGQDQLYRTLYRPAPMFAVAWRFDRSPFKKDDPPAAVAAPAAVLPAAIVQRRPPSSGASMPGRPGAPAPRAPGAPEASRDADVKLRFDAQGGAIEPGALAALMSRATSATDIFIISHGWWNDESTADCFYQRIVGGISRSAPGYLTPDRFRPLFVTVYWPSALFPIEPGDCGTAAPRQESAGSPSLSFSAARVRTWAAAAFPTAAHQPGFANESDRLASMLERERVAPLQTAEAEQVAEILFHWRNATDLTSAPEEGPEASAFAGSSREAAERWRVRSEPRAELTLPGLDAGKKWLNFANAFTFWTMKERAGTVGSKGLYEVLKALQPLRTRTTAPVRIHLIGHSFGGKLVTASLTGAGTAANHADSLIVLQGAFSQFAFATKDEIRAAGVTIDRGGLYQGVLAGGLVTGPIVVTHSSADTPNRLLYPASVAIVNDVTEASRAPRFGSLGANGIRGARSTSIDLASQTLAQVEAGSPRAISVEASTIILGHSDLVKPQVFTLIWDAVEEGR